MTKGLRGPQWAPREEIRDQKKNEHTVELSIRGAEIVRTLAALAEEVSEMAVEEESDEISRQATSLAVALADAAADASGLTGSFAHRSLQLFSDRSRLPARCAILSRDAAAKAARSIRIYQPRQQRGA